jgi:type I restriction-modification system DNA methylase subunit
MSHATGTLTKVQGAVTALGGKNLAATATALIGHIGYTSPKTLAIETNPAQFLAELNIDPAKLAESLPRIKAVHFLFQLTGDELPALSRNTAPQTGASFQRGAIDSFVFLAVDLDDGAWSRRELVTIVRELNRGFAMPAIILFRHGGKATLAVIDRRANRRDPSRDVVGGRISLVKDIDLAAPHRAHVEILADLSLAAIARKKAPADFRDLYDKWIETLSAAELNKRFYAELADWFAWASTKPELVAFPKGQPADEGGKEVGLIRLLTRLMFVWFIKEKGLVTGDLFNADKLTTLMNEPPSSHPKGHDFYLAILQNLFFATLNTEMDQRRWRKDEAGQSKDYLGHHVFRHEAKFADAKAAENLFNQVPFLNGGLFECLDTEITSPEDERKNRAEKERQRLILRVDGFSDQPDKQPRLQNCIFFGGTGDDRYDLSDYFGRRRHEKIGGLIDLFERYKFTIEENTPLEEEAALDPELLGKVFENLLASYNEDTKTTARNKSGSFYTPREVVEFMVDEALLAYLKPKVATPADSGGIRPSAPGLDFGAAPGELGLEATGNSKAAGKADAPDRNEARLRALLDFASRTHDFSAGEVDALIAAIESCKAIDPAVGSGAFPLGLLQKLVHALAVLDPGGEKWRARNRAYYETNLSRAEAIPAPNEREAAMAMAQAELDKFDAAFNSGHYPDYTRKLYLIERCLHGVDIQPIAVQIAKLRCFISLAVEQKADDSRPNRGITPLPNLETKLVAANTLTPLHRNGNVMLVTQDLRTAQSKLRNANRAFFAAANGADKRRVQKQILDLRHEIAALVKQDGIFSGDEAALLAHWDPFDPNSFAPFFDAEWMFGLEPSANEGWFDIALANPPYVRQEKIESFRINGKPVVSKTQLKADYKTYAGTADLLVYFYERALRLLKPEGALAFITSNKWYRAGYGKGLRSWLVENARVLKLMDFGDAPVFEAIAYPTILIATRRTAPGKPAESDTFDAMNWTMGEPVETFPARFAAESFTMPQKDLIGASDWQFIPPSAGEVLSHLRSAGTPLKKHINDTIYRGITTGLNTAFELTDTQRSDLISEHKSSAELIKPLLKGKDLKRWVSPEPTRWIIFARRGLDIDKYPAIKRHLLEFKDSLEPKPKDWIGAWKGRKPGNYQWFEIQDNVAYWPVFEKTKIVSNKVTDNPNFSIDSSGVYLANTAYCFNCNRPEFVVGILNSTTALYVSRRIFVDKEGGFYEVQPDALLDFPIPDCHPDNESLVAMTVRSISVSSQRPRLESLLNAFVYELFFPAELAARGLSPFAAAREAGLDRLVGLEGEALACAADAWSAQLADPATKLYATLFDLQSIDAIRIIEGRG